MFIHFKIPIEIVKGYLNGESRELRNKRKNIGNRVRKLLDSSLSDIYEAEDTFCIYSDMGDIENLYDESGGEKEECTIRTFDSRDIYQRRLELIGAMEDALSVAIMYNRKVRDHRRIDLSNYYVVEEMRAVAEHEFLGHNEVLWSMNGCSQPDFRLPMSYKALPLQDLPDPLEDPLMSFPVGMEPVIQEL